MLGRTKKFATAIKDVFPLMPKDSAELPTYFESIDSIFTMYRVPDDIKSNLFIAHLSGKPKSVISKLSIDELKNYDTVKACILKEFQITARELRARFTQATERDDESHTAFRARLELTLMHYLKSRDANIDVKKLIDLLVADKMKDSLALCTLQYVLSLEGSKCFTSDEVANNADIYCSNYNDNGSYKGTNLFSVSLHGQGKQPFKKFTSNKRYEYKASKNGSLPTDKEITETVTVNTYNMQSTKPNVVKKECFACKSDKHLIADCPKKQSGPTGSRTFVKSAPGSNVKDHTTGATTSDTTATASSNACVISINCEDKCYRSVML